MHFIKLTSTYSQGNRLQTYAINSMKGIDQTQIEDPQELVTYLKNVIDLGNYSFPRCTPLKVTMRKENNYRMKEVDKTDEDNLLYVEVNGLFTFTLYKIINTFDKKAGELKSQKAETLPLFA